MCECKFRSSTGCRSNVGLPICLYPSLVQSTVLQIFMEVLNVTFFPITLYSLRFMIYTKTKPNNSLNGAAFLWAFFFRFVAYPVAAASILPYFMCKQSTSSKPKIIKALFFAWNVFNPSKCFQPTLFHAVFTVFFVPFKIQTYQCSQQSCLFARYFSFEFAAYQPLQRCQSSYANK